MLAASFAVLVVGSQPAAPSFRAPGGALPTAHDLRLGRAAAAFLPFGGGAGLSPSFGGSSGGGGLASAQSREQHAAIEPLAPMWRNDAGLDAPSKYATTPTYAQAVASRPAPEIRSAVDAVASEGMLPASLERTSTAQRVAAPQPPTLRVGPGGDMFTNLRIPAALVNGAPPPWGAVRARVAVMGWAGRPTARVPPTHSRRPCCAGMNPALLPFEPGSYHSQDLTRHRRRAMAAQESDQRNVNVGLNLRGPAKRFPR